MSDTLPLKPRLGEACNGCGLCCRMEVCALGRMVHGEETLAPCPSLIVSHGRSWCELVVLEPAMGGERTIAEALGIGLGCCSEDGPA